MEHDRARLATSCPRLDLHRSGVVDIHLVILGRACQGIVVSDELEALGRISHCFQLLILKHLRSSVDADSNRDSPVSSNRRTCAPTHQLDLLLAVRLQLLSWWYCRRWSADLPARLSTVLWFIRLVRPR